MYRTGKSSAAFPREVQIAKASGTMHREAVSRATRLVDIAAGNVDGSRFAI